MTHVHGEALDDAREYCVATVRVLFDGMDNVAPLVQFAQQHPERIPPRDSGRELKMIVVSSFCTALWRQLGRFEDIDVDHDAHVTADEVRHAIEGATHEAPSSVLVDGIVRALDTDHDGSISAAEAAARAKR